MSNFDAPAKAAAHNVHIGRRTSAETLDMNRNLKAAVVVGNPKPAICPMVGTYLIDKTYAEDPRLDAWVARAQKLIPHAEVQP